MDEDDVKTLENLCGIMLDMSIRQSKKLAKTYKCLYNALMKEGFSDEQALAIILKNPISSFIKNQ